MTRSELDARLDTEYREKRAKAQAALKAREDAAVAADPEIGRLRRELYLWFSDAVRRAMAGPNEAQKSARDLRRRVAENHKELRERLRGARFDEDALEIQFECPACRDTGWLDDYQTKPCVCRLRREADLLMEDAGLSRTWPGFSAFRENIYPTEAQRRQGLAARSICEAYADHFPDNEKPNLLLMGESGLGKTFLMEAIAERVSARRMPVYSVSAFRMLEAMRAYHFGAPGEDTAFQRLLSCDLLLIDDLGTEPMLNNITVEYLFTLFNERCAGHRHTVIATNLLPGDLMKRYGERVMSRLMDTRLCSAIRLTGADLRLSGGAK